MRSNEGRRVLSLLVSDLVDEACQRSAPAEVIEDDCKEQLIGSSEVVDDEGGRRRWPKPHLRR